MVRSPNIWNRKNSGIYQTCKSSSISHLETLVSKLKKHVRLAVILESLIEKDDRFVVEPKRKLSLVCFRLKAGDEATKNLMDAVNNTGFTYLVPSTYCQRFIIRFAIGGNNTQEIHVRETWEKILFILPSVIK